MSCGLHSPSAQQYFQPGVEKGVPGNIKLWPIKCQILEKKIKLTLFKSLLEFQSRMFRIWTRLLFIICKQYSWDKINQEKIQCNYTIEQKI